MSRNTKINLILDLEDKRFIQGRIILPDSATLLDAANFLDDLEERMRDIIMAGRAEEESVVNV